MSPTTRTSTIAALRPQLSVFLLTSAAICAMAIASLAGCSDGRPTRVAVSGKVLIDGKPLTTGIVQLVPDDARPAAGKLDSEGRFTLTSYDGDDGVVLGTHRVMVAAKEMISESKAKWLTPPKYADLRSSGLSVEITEPTDDLTIELTWDGGKPFVQ